MRKDMMLVIKNVFVIMVRMTDFRKLAEKLADRLNDANTILAYLSLKNIIDDEETIMKTWEILIDAYNDIHEPEPEQK